MTTGDAVHNQHTQILTAPQQLISTYSELLGYNSVQAVLKEYDKNGDGKISREEFEPLRRKLESRSKTVTESGPHMKVC